MIRQNPTMELLAALSPHNRRKGELLEELQSRGIPDMPTLLQHVNRLRRMGFGVITNHSSARLAEMDVKRAQERAEIYLDDRGESIRDLDWIARYK